MKKWQYILGFLSLVVITIWLAVITSPRGNLQIIACNVGQGDAFLIQKGNSQILIDAGPGSKVINCLDQYVAFWDRKIEMVVISHPQKDHYGGLADIFKNYQVESLLTSGLDSSSSEWGVLENLVGGTKTKVWYATEVTRLGLDSIYLDILHPSKNFVLANSSLKKSEDQKILGTFTSDDDPNEFSVVVFLTYGNFNALFTGDIGKNISEVVAGNFQLQSNTIEYLKVPHHGSKNGLSSRLLDIVNPEVAVISAGKNNSYGHPHKEILKMLGEKDIRILRTDEMGNVVVETDGEKFWVEK